MRGLKGAFLLASFVGVVGWLIAAAYVPSYLADGTPFWPAERGERAEMLQWLSFEQYSHEPYIAVRRSFFVGGRYGLADIALYAYTHVAEEGGFDLAGYPAIKDWLARVKGQPNHIAIDAAVGAIPADAA